MFAVKKKIVLALILAVFAIAVVAIISFSYNTGATSYSNHTFEQKQLYTYHDPIHIDGNADFTSENGVSAGDGSSTNPYIIENWDINASTANGIDIDNTDVYFIIRNCYIHGSYNYGIHGIYFNHVDNGEIKKVISYNNWYGIYLYSSSTNTISNSNTSNNYKGVELHDSNVNTISYNSMYSNCDYGAFLILSNNNTIIHNNITNSNQVGICVQANSNNNSIHHNNFINNQGGAFDECTNYWDDGTEGNYWSDYDGVDEDGDGIGDTPYDISGGSNKDRYPLMKPWNITVNQPPIVNIIYPTEGQTVNGTITITGTASDPDSTGLVHNLDKDTWYNKIQDTIDDADEGNTIFVYSGVYYENVVIDKSLTLMGEDRNTTIIDGSGVGDVVHITADWVNVSGFGVRCGFYDGITLSTIGCKITNCLLYNNPYGIDIWYSTNTTIENCLAYDNEVAGISSFYSSSNQIINCAFYSNEYGIYLYGTPNNRVANCSIYNNSWVGVCISRSSNNIFRDNALSNNGYDLSVYGVNILHYYQDIDISNTINRKPTYYIVEKSDFVFDNSMDIGYLGFVSCSNMTVDNITLVNNGQGILLVNTSNSIITHSLIYNNSNGVYLYYSSNNRIINSSVDSNLGYWEGHGIYLSYSTDNWIVNSVIYNNNNGITFGDYSSNNTVANCSVYNNNNGFSLDRSSYNLIINCSIFNNSNGIILFYSSSSNNKISYCNITENSNYGCYLHSKSYSANNNMVHHNNFINNTHNAYDECTNFWDNGSVGNYWSDYTGVDGNGDGIGDTPYYISGGSNQDNYPLMNPVNITLSKYPQKNNQFVANTILQKNSVSNGTTVQFVEIKIDDGNWQLANGTTSWSFEWDTTTVSNGWHTIYARAYGGIDYSEVDSVDVYVDNLMSELVPHEPIYIDGNDDFTLENGVVSGSGAESDPYIIEGYDINAGTASYPTYAGVHIENTDVYFIIRNCVIHDGYEEEVRYNYGIYFYNVTNGKIENVTSYRNYYGIWVYDSPNNQIVNCDVYSNAVGIAMYSSSDSTITNCTIYNNSYGISLSRSLNCKVENCIVYNHTWFGISVSSQSSNNRIVNCVVYNNSYYGIQISSSSWNVVINCSIYNNSRYGIYSSYSQYNQIANSILYNNTDYNIYLRSSLYDQVTNCVLYNSNYGACLYSCLYDQISECAFYNNRYHGIYFTSSLYNQIANNKIINCSTGVCFYFSFYNQITNCTLNNNSYSGGSFQFSSNNTVTRCNLSANNQGFYLYSSSNNNYIYHNSFVNNTNNAYDECTNYWDCNGEGNYWGNYTGTDNNGDCIGDIPYSISGGNNKDNCPLMHEFTWWDTEAPVISLLSPCNNSVINPNTVLEFDIIDDNLWKASYSMNNGVTHYFSSPYNISTNGWEDGTYNITIYAKDWGMNEISKMFISTIDGTPPTVQIIEGNQIINATSFTMHWGTNATDTQFYEISTDGSHWVNVETNTSYTFINLVEGFNILYVRGIDIVNNAGISSSIIIVVEIPISEDIIQEKEEVNWLLYGSIIIVIFIALILAGIGITWARRVKGRKVLYPQKLKCVYCQETMRITSSDRPLLFQCSKCGGKNVIR